MNDLQARLAALTPQQRELLMRQLGRAAPREEPIPVLPRDGRHFPLSFAQERRLFLEELEPGGAAANVYGATQLEGDLDVAALSRAMDALLARHEVLRTTFETLDGRPRQVIAPHATVALPVLELAARDEGERERALRETCDEFAARPFDLRVGPLLRAALVRLGPRRHALLLAMHHIVSDAWSMGVFFRELGELYEAGVSGRPSNLAPPRVQYVDFAAWQRARLSGERLERLLAHWRAALRGAPPVLELPADRPRPERPTERGATLGLTLSREVCEALRRLAQRHGASLFMALLTGFKALLTRYSGQTDVVVGTPVANRVHADVEGTLGLFVNTLALRSDLSGDPSFEQALARVAQTTHAALEHQDLPFERLVEELRPERDLRVPPLFQVMFQLQNALASQPRLCGLEARPLPMDAHAAGFDLLLTLSEHEGALQGLLQYACDLFDPATAERFARHFTRLSAGAARAPHLRLSALPLLDEAERAQALLPLPASRQAGPDVVRLVAEQAARTPQAVALRDGARQLDYAELRARAGALAARLQAEGVERGARVGLSAGRAPETLVALLAILEAGAACVPLDPDFPAQRLAGMLADARPTLVLVDAAGAAALGTRARCLRLDQASATATGPLAPVAIAPDDLVYVLYTSGSTGRPKGVALRHAVLGQLVAWQLAEPGYQHGPVVTLQFTSLSFDVSFQEIFVTWASGGTLVLVPDDVRRDGERLLACLARERIERLFLPFVALQQLALAAEQPGAPWPSALREVVTAGEALRVTPQLVALFERLPGCRLHNQYGPAETHVATAHALPADARTWPALPSIGRAVAGARVYVLDATLEPQPTGVTGEVFIGGEALARGYFERPDLTAERFLPDPHGLPGARLYRTGDLARRLADGTLAYVGRSDFQVKIRGYRVEPGEIEALLGRQAGVSACAVSARAGAGGVTRLLAYVVPRAPGACVEAELRAHLRATLPEYMLPAAFIELDALPLTATGKLDRRALPEPGEQPGSLGAEAGPQGPLEELLAQIWAEVLGRERVSREADFFELGGHSLLATQVTSRVRRALGRELPVRALFEAPRLRELALRLAGADALDPAAPALVPGARAAADAPASYAQERLWFLDQLYPGRAVYNVPLALRLDGRLERAALRAALEMLVARHEVLRTVFAPGTPPRQILLPSAPLDWREARLPADPAAVTEELRAEARRAFDLARGPLVRAALLQAAEESHVLVLTLHHATCDGWSLGVLLRDLAAAYRAALGGRPAALPALPVQYADFALWQRAWLQGQRLEGLLAFWRARLGALPALELPLDRARPALESSQGARVEARWSEELRGRLARLGRDAGASLFMLLQAALVEVLHRYSGQQRIALGTPVSGRGRPELEELVGFFVNTLVLVTETEGAVTFLDLLARARETALSAWAHQDVPFERLVAELQPERDLGRSPFFQVLLVVHNTPATEFELPGLRATPVPVELDLAKFDLTLSASESAGGLQVAVEYRSELFERATAERLLGHVRTLLEGALVSPEGPRAALPLLAEAERRQVVEVWNARPAPAGAPVCLHELFEQQARARPQARALTDGTTSWTYAQLDARAEQLAAWLRLHGVARGTRVGVCLSRTVELVAALLGVLKAGGAYVGLDPHYPSERLAFMVRDSASAVVLTEGELSGRADWGASRVVRVEECAGGPVTSIARGASSAARDVAYVIYTSGSTGVPKGVAIEHCSAVARVRWAAGEFDEQELGGVLAGTSVCFDLSIFELFVPLCLGGRVVLAPDVLALARHAARDEVRLINSVPSAVSELVRQQALPASVTTVNLAGEALRNRLCQELYATGHVKRVLNLYGPSEDTTYSTGVQVRSGAQDEPSIGRPLPGTRAYVLDGLRRPVPVGVVGELYLGGVGLSRGYLGRAELTAWRYVPDEFGAPGERLYRTGDLARWRADGELQFLGRGDHQVKVRGFRIELGEVEAALLSQVGVQDAAVQARGEAGTAEQVLVAYVEARAGALLSVEELRSALASRLPAHEVPSTFVLLERLPRTPNGKLDRARLPAPSAERPELQAAYVAPRGALQEALAGIWREVLALERVGQNDNFFELGGHSLRTVQVQRLLRERLAREVTLVELFEHPTLAALARHLEGAAAGPTAPTEDRQAGRERLRRQALRRRAVAVQEGAADDD